jgi:hypothetical protein
MAEGVPSRIIAVALLVAVVSGGTSWQTGAAAATDSPSRGTPKIQDDGEKFVAYYGHLEESLSLPETWRVLRGLRKQLERLAAKRKVAAIIYHSGGDLHLAAIDFEANEVFIDRVGSKQAFAMIWHRVEPDFSPTWSLRAPDRIESTGPELRI